ncbi:MAG: metal ABC transporter substrate-binding protein [Spirochaetaceae bacterium]|jgi:zinc transport system substrate-binding protein|nr:metal ABC transporter substrate-binding protein [Spirochaetaceae bacterium]
MKRIAAAAAAMVFSALFFACRGEKGGGQPAGGGVPPTGTLSIIAANFPAYDFARAVTEGAGGRGPDASAGRPDASGRGPDAGAGISLTMLLPPGAESHSFEPAPRDIIAIQNCAVFIYTGGESDRWAGRILETAGGAGINIVRMLDIVDAVEEELVEGMEDEGEPPPGAEAAPAYDEHVWTSPANAARIVAALADTLCIAGEGNGTDSALFRRNADAYIERLGELDKEFRAVASGAARKTLVFGDRFPFRYFADAYGFTYFAAFPGCSTESEPAAATVAFLINKIREEKIPVVFHIELSNEKMADAIAAETGAKKLLLHSGQTISKKDFDAGLTFVEIQKANIPRLKEALW